MDETRTTWLGRRKRVRHYDARWADGHLERDVAVDRVLQGARFPADAWATRDAADAALADGDGPGLWVGYAGRAIPGDES